MHTIYLALGTNVGDKKVNIEKAIMLLKEKIHIYKKAPIYETKPWGYKTQDNFFNTALQAATNLPPQDLLLFIKIVEKKIGRIKRFKNGPREIDIDILFYDQLIYARKDLQIPHPRIAERDFVLQPLSDINPNLIHPVLQKSIQQLLGELSKLTLQSHVINKLNW